MLIRKTDGSILQRLGQQYDLENAQEPTESTRKKGFFFYRRAPLEPGDYLLEAVVRDRRTDTAAVRKAEFRVPPAGQEGFGLSSIALGRESVPAGDNDAAENPFRLEDPMRLAGARLLPNLSGVYSRSSDKELVIYFVVRSRAASPPINGTFEFFRDGVPDLKLEEALAAADAEGKIQSVKHIGLNQLKPGAYELRVTVRNADSSASGSAKFRIDP